MKHNNGIILRILAVLTVLLCVALVSLGFAEEIDETEGRVVDQRGITNEEASEQYIYRQLGWTSKVKNLSPLFRGSTARDNLGTVSGAIYDALHEKILLVADGEMESTDFSFNLNTLLTQGTCTLDELGVQGNVIDDTVVRNAITPHIDSAVTALLADCPYELYWFDKTIYSRSNGGYYSVDDGKITFSNYTVLVKLTVAQAYAKPNAETRYEFNTVLPAKVKTAASTAKKIVAKYAGQSDYNKLYSYKSEICCLTDYNHSVVGNSNISYGDPWQLIDVFDGDPSTMVVCEGYSKAFQYLCDLSTFTAGTKAISVTGTMYAGNDGGGHMWNVVTLGEYRYLADITNSDTNSIGEKGELFLAGYNSHPSDNQYTYSAGGIIITYTYDNYTLDNFAQDSHEELQVYSLPYAEIETYGYFPKTQIYWTLYKTGLLSVCGVGAIPDRDTSSAEWQSDTLKKQNIKSIFIENGITSIGTFVFDTCTFLESVYLPDSLEAIGSFAFSGCSCLTSISLPGKVKTIGEGAFSSCRSLSTIMIPGTVTNIGYSLFDKSNSLTAVYFCGTQAQWDDLFKENPSLSNGVLRIHDFLKHDRVDPTTEEAGCKEYWECRICDKLFLDEAATNPTTAEALTIPPITTVCGDALNWAFDTASATLTVTGTGAMYDYSTTSPAPWEDLKANINTITLDSGVTTIGAYAFYGCTAATTINIPASLAVIGSNAFADCDGLAAVHIPKSVTSLAGDAFADCSALMSVCYCGTQDSWTAFNVSLPSGALVSYHVPGTSVVENTVAASCTAAGSYEEVIYCSLCGDEISRTVQAIPMVDHMLTGHDAHDATCTVAGNIAYWDCSVCHKIFSDNTGTNEVQTYVINALGHDPQFVSVVSATCTANGTAAHWECSRCHELYFNDNNKPGAIAAMDELVIKAAHTLVHHDARAATCTEAGNTEYWTCSVCNKSFSDDKGETQITSYIAPPLDHSYGEAQYTWAADNSTVTASHTCIRVGCDFTETETVDATGEVTTPAACETDGVRTFTSEAFANAAFTVQIKTEPIKKTGHSYDGAEVVYTWAEDYSTVTAARTCVRNGCDHKQTETVNTTNAVTTAPTCTAAGVRTYTSAVFENAAFAVQTKEVAELALGHSWGSPAYTWSADNTEVTAECACIHDGCLEKQVETVDTTSVVKQPTCTEEGTATYTAVFTNPAFAQQAKTVETDAALGHSYGSPSYAWSADNSKVTATRACNRDGCAHEETETVNTTNAVTTAPTCTADGVRTWTSAAFSNPAFEVRSKDVTEPALGHNPQRETEVLATCTEDGCKAHWKCSGCGKLYLDDNGSPGAVTAADALILPRGHELEQHAAQAATCTEPGWNAYESCKRCGYTTKVDIPANSHALQNHAAQAATCTDPGWEAYDTCENCAYTTKVVIPALGHDWEYSYDWDETNYSEVTATRVCKRDCCANNLNAIEIKTVSTTRLEEPATCEAPGRITYTAVFTNSAFTTQTREVVSEPALGHSYGGSSYIWSEDNSTVTATHTCTRDGCAHKETETANTTNTVTTAPTCTADGVRTYTSAAFVNVAFLVQAKEVPEPALDHTYGSPTYTWSADNSQVTAKRACTRSGCTHDESETVSTTGEVTRAATCKGKGVTTYTTVFKNAAFSRQAKTVENLNALGHSYGSPTYTWSADNSQVAAKRACTRDGCTHEETETVNTAGAVTTAPTCTAAGVRTYTGAAFANSAFTVQSKEVPEPALDHSYGSPAYTWSADNSQVTAKRACTRNGCTHEETEIASTTGEVTRAATCEGKGATTYTAVFTNAAFEKQAKTVENLDALGHSWGEPSYEWAADHSSATASHTCVRDPGHTETETAAASVQTTPATTEAEGSVVYTAVFTNPAFAAQAYTEILAMLPPEKIDLETAIITPIEDQPYNDGKAVKPELTVTAGGKTLVLNTDYTVSWKKNKAIGKATVTLAGMGSYTGTKKAKFNIVPKAVDIASLKAGSKKLTVRWKFDKKNDFDGYEIEYSLKKNFKNASTVNIKKPKTTSTVIKKLKKGKTYYVRIRTWKKVGKTYYYSEWSPSRKLKVK